MPEQRLALRALNRATLARQRLLEPFEARTTVAAAVERLGGLQAQHPEWPRIALWARHPGLSREGLRSALASGQVVRTTAMRRTIHVVSAADFWTIRSVTQPIQASAWRLQYGEDPNAGVVIGRMRPAVEAARAALAEGPLPPAEISGVMRRALRTYDDGRPTRSLWQYLAIHVPLVHVPWDGEGYGRSRYACAEDVVGPPPGEPDEAQGYVLLARRYLAAFGPASFADLGSFLGRSAVAPRRAALQRLGDALVRLRGHDGRELLDLVDAPRPHPETPAPPRLLARWDSILLAHQPAHRLRILPEAYRTAVFTPNADVRPSFTIDGSVAGTWAFAADARGSRIELAAIGSLRAPDRDALVAEAERLLRWLEPDRAGHVSVGSPR